MVDEQYAENEHTKLWCAVVSTQVLNRYYGGNLPQDVVAFYENQGTGPYNKGEGPYNTSGHGKDTHPIQAYWFA